MNPIQPISGQGSLYKLYKNDKWFLLVAIWSDLEVLAKGPLTVSMKISPCTEKGTS